MKGYIQPNGKDYYINVEHIVSIGQDNVCKDFLIIRTSNNDTFYVEMTIDELFSMIKQAKRG